MKNEKYISVSYQSAVGVAVVAAVFSVFVAVLLAVTAYHVKVTDPARLAELEVLKEQAKANPADAVLAERVLALDTPLRRDQFARLYFLKRGTILLVGTLGLLAAGVLWAGAHKPLAPMPEPQGDVKAQQVIHAQRSRTALSIVMVVLCGGALFWTLRAPSMPVDSAEPGEEPAAPVYATMDQAASQWSVFRGHGGLGVCTFDNIPDTWDGESDPINFQKTADDVPPIVRKMAADLPDNIPPIAWNERIVVADANEDAQADYSVDDNSVSGESKKNILWKTAIDLPGYNSPVVWGDRIFLTGATKEAQRVYCVDAVSGEILWQQDVRIVPSEARDDMEIMEDTGYAACTAVTDGMRVCAIFAGGDMACYTADGKPLWEKHLGVPDSMYGFSASLTWYENLVIVQWDVGYDGGDESMSKLMAFDWQTGDKVWQTHRPVPNSWSSPTVIQVGDAYQILTTASPYVIAYDAETGTEIYRAECIDGDIASTPIVADNKIFAIEPYNKLAAIDTVNAQGDVTESHIVWTNDTEMPDICSPVSDGQHIWTLTTQGDLSCFKVSDGSNVYTQSLEANFQASPTLVGEMLYLLTEKGVMILAETGETFKEIKRNNLGEKAFASPAFQEGRIYLRGHDHLYAIGAER